MEKFGFGQITGETLPNFRQESKENFKSNCSRKGKIVICARQLPGVGHAQGLVRIPKWNWDRVLSKQIGETIDEFFFPKWLVTIISKHDSGNEDIFIPTKIR